MRSPAAKTEPLSFMEELIDLLTNFPPDRNRRRAEVIALRFEHLEARARSQGAAVETLVAIQGARVLLELAELPPMPPSSAAS